MDIDECITGNHNCDVNASCIDTVGGHNCSCKEGFAGEGRSCLGKLPIRVKLEPSVKSFVQYLTKDTPFLESGLTCYID